VETENLECTNASNTYTTTVTVEYILL